MIWSLVLWPVASGLALWLWGAGAPGRLTAAGCAAMGATLVIVLAVLAAGGPSSVAWSSALTLRADLGPLASAVAVLVPAIGICVTLFAGAHEEGRGLARLIGLLLVFTGAMELVVIANDLVTLLIGWELMGAISWVLIGHRWREAPAMPSATYAFVMTRSGDLGLFLALFACFAGAGSADYAALADLDGTHRGLAAFGILVAAAAKAGQGPFAPWLFRAMDGPTSVSAFLHSSTMVAAGAFLVARLQPSLVGVPGFGAAAIALGLATALAGGLVALRQDHAKKVLAGSTSAQLGLMFAAAGAGWPGLAILHMIAHAAFKAPLFFAAGLAHERTGSFDLRRMRLGRAMPATAALVLLPALALAGVPPLGGAWTKEAIVTALGHAAPWLAIAAIAAGGLSAAYATRFALLAFRPGDADEGPRPGRAGPVALGALSLATVLLSALWWPGGRHAAAEAMAIDLPAAGPAIESAATLALVAAGALAGLFLARHPREGDVADWFGLPRLIEIGVIRPFGRLARAAARFDDAVCDAIPRGIAGAGRGLAPVLAGADDRVLDGMAGAAPGAGAIALVVRAGTALARVSSRGGERAFDLIAEGTGRLLGMAGADLRRMQSGLSHHYYVILVAGTAAGGIILILGAR